MVSTHALCSVSELVRLWFAPGEGWDVHDAALLPRRLELTRYVMWCFLLNDFGRLLKGGDTYVFKKPTNFVTEGGVIIYLNNHGANW